jgi:hypothetical protein
MPTAGANIASSIMAMEANIMDAAGMRPSMAIMLTGTMIATAGRTAAKCITTKRSTMRQRFIMKQRFTMKPQSIMRQRLIMKQHRTMRQRLIMKQRLTMTQRLTMMRPNMTNISKL